MSKTIKQSVYVTLMPSWTSTYDKQQGRPPTGFTVGSIVRKKPKAPKAGLTIELVIELDEDIFDPIEPSASIKIERDRAAESGAAVVVGKRVKSQGAPNKP